MNDNARASRPLVGQACYVAAPYLHASKGGRVIDVMPLAQEYLVKHDSGQEWWYDFAEVAPLTPVDGWEDVGQVDRPIELTVEAPEPEHNFAADELAHTAAIEARLAGANLATIEKRHDATGSLAPTYDTARQMARLAQPGVHGYSQRGTVTARGTAAYVPKGGA